MPIQWWQTTPEWDRKQKRKAKNFKAKQKRLSGPVTVYTPENLPPNLREKKSAKD